MLGLGFGELVLILLIALIFIGPKKLPELAKGLGQGIKEFQKAAKGFTDNLQDTSDNTPTSKPVETVHIADTAQHPTVAPIETIETAPVDKENKPS